MSSLHNVKHLGRVLKHLRRADAALTEKTYTIGRLADKKDFTFHPDKGNVVSPYAQNMCAMGAVHATAKERLNYSLPGYGWNDRSVSEKSLDVYHDVTGYLAMHAPGRDYENLGTPGEFSVLAVNYVTSTNDVKGYEATKQMFADAIAQVEKDVCAAARAYAKELDNAAG